MLNFPKVKDRYEIENVLSQGGQAVICKATDTHLKNKKLAAKCFNLLLSDSKESAAIERKILSSYRHPSIPIMFDEAQVGNTYFIFMDFIEGSTLAELASKKQLSNSIILDCMRNLAKTLDYCHSHPSMPIVYGDLKPENIIKCQDGRWVLVDYASSVFIDQDRKGLSRKKGTPGFAAPELVAGLSVTPASDVYSLAALMYYLQNGTYVNPQNIHLLEPVLKKALENNPVNRFSSTTELVLSLDKQPPETSTKNITCKACGNNFAPALKECPRCQTPLSEHSLKVQVQWELPNTQTLITSLANSRLYKFLERRLFVDGSWKSIREEAEKLQQFRGFEKLITINRLKNIEPYSHQQETVLKFLNDFHCNGILADEVGLGKTIEAGMIISEMVDRKLVKKVLIVAPNHLVSQWKEDMLEKIGIKFEDFTTFNIKRAAYVVVPFFTFRNSSNRSLFENSNFDLVVVDEAHNLVTNSGVSKGWETLNAMKRKYNVLITATPIKRRITDLFHLVTLIRPGEFRSFYDFERLYIDPYNPQKTKNTNQLRQILSSLVIRNQRKTFAQNWPAKKPFSRVVQEQQKPLALLEILRNNSKDMSIVFTNNSPKQHEVFSFLQSNNSSIGNRQIFYLSGDRFRKNETIHKFRYSNNGVLIADKTSSEGRNLQFCHLVINYDIPTDPIEIEQRIGRVYRIGQKNDVHIYNLAAKDTLEEYLLDLYDQHLKLFSLWVGEIYDVIGHLEKNESIPIKANLLWNLYSNNLPEFRKKWNEYISGIIKNQQDLESTDEALNTIYGQIFGV